MAIHLLSHSLQMPSFRSLLINRINRSRKRPQMRPNLTEFVWLDGVEGVALVRRGGRGGSDVFVGDEEQNDFSLLVLDRNNVQQTPEAVSYIDKHDQSY